jgi:hypothetical protein
MFAYAFPPFRFLLQVLVKEDDPTAEQLSRTLLAVVPTLC